MMSRNTPAARDHPGRRKAELAESLQGCVQRIAEIPGVCKIVLYGSYAKGTQTETSDIDLAVFFASDKPCLLDEYRQLVRLVSGLGVDVQVQAFHAFELIDPCGIIEEILTFGIELPLTA